MEVDAPKDCRNRQGKKIQLHLLWSAMILEQPMPALNSFSRMDDDFEISSGSYRIPILNYFFIRRCGGDENPTWIYRTDTQVLSFGLQHMT